MTLLAQVRHLIRKDLILELRSKYAINGILLYVVSTIFVCYQAFQSLEPITWIVLFWVIMLFASINATSKSFIQESTARGLYYHTLVSPRAVILAKIIYNVCMMIFLATLAFIVYAVIFGNPLGDPGLFLFGVLLGAVSFASVFTMVSGISSKAGNNVTLMSILSFPVIMPLIIVLVDLSKNAMEGTARVESMPEIISLIAINIIAVAISLLLFPYLWKE